MAITYLVSMMLCLPVTNGDKLVHALLLTQVTFYNESTITLLDLLQSLKSSTDHISSKQEKVVRFIMVCSAGSRLQCLVIISHGYRAGYYSLI